MTTHTECPICMDDIKLNANCVTTECGHCFHASCLMRNVAHNGFGCPYCRTTMAEEPEEDDDSEWSEISNEEEMFDDFALRGFRFFMNNIEGEEHDQEDATEEQEDIEEAQQEEEELATNAKPPVAFIAEKLLERGVTMEHLLKIVLRDHDEYDRHDEEFQRVDDDVFGKIRIIISNYEPQTQHQSQLSSPEAIEQQLPSEQVDYSSQPKQYANVTIRRPMTHL